MQNATPERSIAVWIQDDACATEAQRWSAELGLPLVSRRDDSYAAFLACSTAGLSLAYPPSHKTPPFRVDFVKGPTAYRIRQSRAELLFDAIGLRKGIRHLVDATGGFLRDTMLLAVRGCKVHAIERNPIVHALAADALRRAAEAPHTAEACARITLTCDDATKILNVWQDSPPEAIYLDPMYPSRKSSALVKKELRIIRTLVGDDLDAAALAEAAKCVATDRVVVKRMIDAPPLAGHPTYSVKEKTTRFDVYKRL